MNSHRHTKLRRKRRGHLKATDFSLRAWRRKDGFGGANMQEGQSDLGATQLQGRNSDAWLSFVKKWVRWFAGIVSAADRLEYKYT